MPKVGPMADWRRVRTACSPRRVSPWASPMASGRLALSERRRCDRSDDDVVGGIRTTATHVLTGIQHAQIDLGHIAAVGNDVLGGDSR